jgi:hypothetical protein
MIFFTTSLCLFYVPLSLRLRASLTLRHSFLAIKDSRLASLSRFIIETKIHIHSPRLIRRLLEAMMEDIDGKKEEQC